MKIAKWPDVGDLAVFLDRDADYDEGLLMTGPVRVFFEPSTGKFLELPEDLEAWDGMTGAATGMRMPSAEAVEIKIPDHARFHEWFRAWLASRGQEATYSGSIGRWLRDAGDDSVRHHWEAFRFERIEEYFGECLRAAGYER